jgi:plasmid stability protein
MTLTIELPDDKDAALANAARVHGVSPEQFARQVLERAIQSEPVRTGAELVAAMQASPYPEISLEPRRGPLPVRDVTF